MTFEVSKRKSSDEPLAADQSEQWDRWIADNPTTEDEPTKKAMPTRYVKLSSRNGWVLVPALVPHTEHWVKVRKAELWSAIKQNGLPSHFVTLTYADGQIDDEKAEQEFSKAYNAFMTRLKRYLRKRNYDWKAKYCRVLEYGSEHGRLHYHLTFWDLPFIANRVLADMWRIGFVHIVEPNAVGAIKAEFPKFMKLTPEQQEVILSANRRLQYHVAGLVGYMLQYILKPGADFSKRPKNIRAVSYSRKLFTNDYISPTAHFKEMLGECTNPLWDALTSWEYAGMKHEADIDRYEDDTYWDGETWISVEKGSLIKKGTHEPFLPYEAIPKPKQLKSLMYLINQLTQKQERHNTPLIFRELPDWIDDLYMEYLGLKPPEEGRFRSSDLSNK